jgi:formylglycine-generating enzyme required for sulfatase activity
MLVSNGEYLPFVEEGGYSNPEWWTEEGKRWIASIKPSMPLFWHKQ